MADGFEITQKSKKSVQAKILAVASKNPILARKAMLAEGRIEKNEMIQRTPVDKGPLRGSYEMEFKDEGGSASINPTVRISVGGPSAPYAPVVHEDMEAFHKVGQAKFMESVLLESRVHFARRLAVRLKIKGV